MLELKEAVPMIADRMRKFLVTFQPENITIEELAVVTNVAYVKGLSSLVKRDVCGRGYHLGTVEKSCGSWLGLVRSEPVDPESVVLRSGAVYHRFSKHPDTSVVPLDQLDNPQAWDITVEMADMKAARLRQFDGDAVDELSNRVKMVQEFAVRGLPYPEEFKVWWATEPVRVVKQGAGGWL